MAFNLEEMTSYADCCNPEHSQYYVDHILFPNCAKTVLYYLCLKYMYMYARKCVTQISTPLFIAVLATAPLPPLILQ